MRPLRSLDEVRRLTKAAILAYVEQLHAELMKSDSPPTADAAFWLVWNGKSSNAPTHRHYDQDGAKREAERLAANNPGVPFYVLPATRFAIAEVQPVAWKCEEEMPF